MIAIRISSENAKDLSFLSEYYHLKAAKIVDNMYNIKYSSKNIDKDNCRKLFKESSRNAIYLINFYKNNEKEKCQAILCWIKCFNKILESKKKDEKDIFGLKDLIAIDINNNFGKTIGNAVALFKKERKGIPKKKEIKEELLKLFKLSLEIYEIKITYLSQLKRNYIAFLKYLIESKEIKEWERLKFKRMLSLNLDDDNKIVQKELNAIKSFLDDDIFPGEKNKYIEEVIEKNEKEFFNYLQKRSIHSNLKEGYYLLVLRKWNSYTPALSFSEGGGYFFFKTDSDGKVELGIVIDPGYSFIKNLFHHGFTIPDIDFVLLTHDHPDHISDFEDLVTLMFEVKNRSKKEKKFYAVMSQGCFHHLETVLNDSKDVFLDTIIMKSGDKLTIENENTIKMEIDAVQAFHKDISQDDCLGFRFKMSNEEEIINWGYTGDTIWEKSLPNAFKGCDLLCAHLGSIIKPDDDNHDKFKNLLDPKKLLETLAKENHLCLPGVLSLFDEKDNCHNPKIGIISEFGEEMKGGVRTDFIKNLNKWSENIIFAPADVGLFIKLSPSIIKNDKIESGDLLSSLFKNKIIYKNNKDSFSFKAEDRDKLVEKLKDVEEKKKKLIINLWEESIGIRFFCIGCKRFIKPERINNNNNSNNQKFNDNQTNNKEIINYSYINHGHGAKESTYYFCKHCKEVLGSNLINEKIEEYKREGFPLEKSNDDDDITIKMNVELLREQN